MHEEWKDIAGYEGVYQVSSEGRVKSLARRIQFHDGRHRDVNEKVLRLTPDKDGYLLVGLNHDRKRTTAKVHRLVASAFVPNPGEKSVVNHLNEIKNDNRASNLEWTTILENTRYGNGHLRLSKAMSVPVFVYDYKTGFKKIFSSALSASKVVGVSQASLSYALHTGHLSHGRYRVEAV